jgi:hypothetical protein
MSGSQVEEIIPKWCIRLESSYPTFEPTDDGYDTEGKERAGLAVGTSKTLTSQMSKRRRGANQ